MKEAKYQGTHHLEKSNFDLFKTIDCGQCFRWSHTGERFIGVVNKSILVIVEEASQYTVDVYGSPLSKSDLQHYFDLDTDYEPIYNVLMARDETLKKAVESGWGLRMMHQAPFETLISFILSSNNNIPKIKMTIEALAERFGEPLGTLEGQAFYAFPEVHPLAEASLEALNVKAIGYRAKSVSFTAKKIVEESLDLSVPFALTADAGRTWLKQFYGVGDKVADCILLFAYEKEEAFPIDTWVKKMLMTLYGVEKNHMDFIKHYFIAYPGVAQQLLFYYIRNIQNKG